MKKSQKATSILEAMIVLLIIITWVTWLYQIFDNSNKLSNSTKKRIEAVEIAREWIEAMKNIRDTNWIMFWWDKKNCYNTLNYNVKCVGNLSLPTEKIEDNKSYKIYQNNNFKWYLSEMTPIWVKDFSNPNYRDDFRVYTDNNWYYTQTGSILYDETIFTREIAITLSWNDKMTVKSIVQWVDSSKEWIHTIELENLITNWNQD